MSQADQKPTPLVQFGGILFKREDKNITGSIKDRGIKIQIEDAVCRNQKRLVISSSGNAAISAAYFCQQSGQKLTAFVSPRINPNKLDQLKRFKPEIISAPRPLTESLQYAKRHGLCHLRQSTDPVAVIGCRAVAFELHNALVKYRVLSQLFVPVSSGTSLAGIYEGFVKLKEDGKIEKLPQFHAVQTAAVHPIASQFDKDFRRKARSLADAIVARSTPRQGQVVRIVKQTGGSGWVIEDQAIAAASEWLRDRGVVTSNEGALALAAVWKARQKGWQIDNPVVLLTGKKY